MCEKLQMRLLVLLQHSGLVNTSRLQVEFLLANADVKKSFTLRLLFFKEKKWT